MKLTHRLRHAIRHSFFLAGLMSIAWFLLRTGTKPSRFTYPCQQLAASTGYLWALAYLGIPLAALAWLKRRATPGSVAVVISGILCAGIVFSSLSLLGGGVAAGPAPGTPVQVDPAAPGAGSDIFVVEGSRPYTGELDDLLALMDGEGLRFYRLSTPGAPEGMIGKDDVVLIKVNCQWPERGGTSTDLVRSVIAAILAHPEGFEGEIVVVDNGQGRGSFEWPAANAEDPTRSIQDVVDSFSTDHRVSTYLWDTIRNKPVPEYNQGSMDDGYVVNGTPHPRTGLKVTYPKFTTVYGTRISFRNGIWENGSYDNTGLKLINMPVLKTHGGYGVTGSLKHYVGVVSVPLGDPHTPIWSGGLGTALTETRYPDLTILDATWVNAVPKGYSGQGPSTPYGVATRTDRILAGTDPVALDYYAAKHLLMPLASAAGYSTATMDPDSPESWTFGAWLRATCGEIQAAGYPVTMDEGQMTVHYLKSSIWPSGKGVFRPVDGENWILDYGTDGDADYRDHYGNATDIPLLADFNNDGAPDRAVFRGSAWKNWIIDHRVDGSVDVRDHFGMKGDIPLAGHLNRDAVTDRAVFRSGQWIIDYSMDGTAEVRDQFGTAGDIPLTGDFNNDGTPDRGVFRASAWENWILDLGIDGSVDSRNRFGQGGDIPLTGDFDGDGKTDRVVLRSGEWIIDLGMDGSVDSRQRFGLAGDRPLAWNT